MAKKPSPPPAAKAPAQRGKQKLAPARQSAPTTHRRASTIMWSMVIAALLLPWIMPTLVVVFFGMLPGLVALLVDRARGKYGAISIITLNFAGLFPYLLKLWSKSQSLESAVTVIADVFTLLVIYGAAGAGLAIYMIVPTTIASVFQVLSQHRIVVLRDQQRKILEEWGESIARPEAASKS